MLHSMGLQYKVIGEFHVWLISTLVEFTLHLILRWPKGPCIETLCVISLHMCDYDGRLFTDILVFSLVLAVGILTTKVSPY